MKKLFGVLALVLLIPFLAAGQGTGAVMVTNTTGVLIPASAGFFHNNAAALNAEVIGGGGGGGGPSPLFNFNCDSRTATQQENGNNTWPFWFATNVMNAAVFPTISFTNFFIHGSPGATLTQYSINLSNNPTGYLLPLQTGQKGYSIVDGGVNDSAFTATQLEAVYGNIYAINKAHGYFTVVTSEYPAQNWPPGGFGLTQEAVNGWLVGQQGVAWDFYVPLYENMTSNMFGDIAHQNAYGDRFTANLVFQSLFGSQNGAFVNGNQLTTNGLILRTNSNVPLTFATDGKSGLWVSNGPAGIMTYLRSSSQGNTNFTDSPFANLASLTLSGQNFTQGLDVTGIFNVDGPASGLGPKIGLNAIPTWGWDIAINGSSNPVAPLGSLYFLNRQTTLRTYVDVTSDVWHMTSIALSGSFVANASTFDGAPNIFVTSSSTGPFVELTTDGSGNNYKIGSAGASLPLPLGSFYIYNEQTSKYDVFFNAAGAAFFTNDVNTSGNFNGSGRGVTNLLTTGLAQTNVPGQASTNYAFSAGLKYNFLGLSQNICLTNMAGAAGWSMLDIVTTGTNVTVSWPTNVATLTNGTGITLQGTNYQFICTNQIGHTWFTFSWLTNTTTAPTSWTNVGMSMSATYPIGFTAGTITGGDGFYTTGTSGALVPGTFGANTVLGNGTGSSAVATALTVLPAMSGANLTSLTAANLTGPLPAISGAALTSLPYRAGQQAIGNLATSQTVTFSTALPSSSYAVSLTADGTLAAAVGFGVTSKSTTGFTITLSAGISGGVTVDYVASMNQ